MKIPRERRGQPARNAPYPVLGGLASLIVAPGPDNILVLTRGITLGRKAALVSAAGATTGLVCHSLFAAAGLSAHLARSAVAFSVVKYAGAAYLIYLGARALLGRERFVLSEEVPTIGLRSVFVQALTSNVLNPKIAVFFLAYLPQFAGSSTGATSQLLGLGLAFALLTWAGYSASLLSFREAWESGSGAGRRSRAGSAGSRAAC